MNLIKKWGGQMFWKGKGSCRTSGTVATITACTLFENVNLLSLSF